MDSVQVVLQARMSSSRLPGKVLADLEGKPMILRQLERTSLAKNIDRVTVAISDDPSDDDQSDVLSDSGVDVRRGASRMLHSGVIRWVSEIPPKMS